MMKKLLSILLFSALGMAYAWAYDFSAVAPSGQTLYYTISGSTVSVTYPGGQSSNPYAGYTQPTGALTIPASVTNSGRTYSVTSIGDHAFSHCSGLTSVTIPNSVTSIGDHAFQHCSGLTSVTIPNSVTSIEAGAFFNCSGLMSVTIPNSVTSIGEWAFWRVGNIVYHGTATGSPWGALCVNGYIEGDLVYADITRKSLIRCRVTATSVTIPNSVTSIGDYAFYGCSGLTSVTIPNSVTSIGGSAFYGCSGLTSVTIGNSVTSIGGYAFYGCSGLTSVTIPNSVTSIRDCAFRGCSGLTSVTIPNSVTSIGDQAFFNCSGLTSVTIPNSVTSIGIGAFSSCSGLRKITAQPTVAPTLGSNAFENVSNTIPVHIPYGSRASYSEKWSYFSNFVESGVGIDEAETESDGLAIRLTAGAIRVSGAEGQQLTICDMMGRVVVREQAVVGKEYRMPAAGTYLVQVGSSHARKVVVMR